MLQAISINELSDVSTVHIFDVTPGQQAAIVRSVRKLWSVMQWVVPMQGRLQRQFANE